GYDPLDPYGNVTIKWDVVSWPADASYDKYRKPTLNIFGHFVYLGPTTLGPTNLGPTTLGPTNLEAVEQGNCFNYGGTSSPPHCCKKNPQVVDLLPGAPYNMQTANCCKGGVLSSMNQDPTKYGSMFQMHIGNAPSINITELKVAKDLSSLNKLIPGNFSLGLPGYTCAEPRFVQPSKFYVDNGRRAAEAFMSTVQLWMPRRTWNQMHQVLTITLEKIQIDMAWPGESQSVLQLPHHENQVVPPAVMCTRHMCPIRVHWHVKVSYRDYWRVKMTINNFNYVKNYSQWSLVVQHPNLESVVQVFSFNYKPLDQYGYANDSGMFWGIQYYNDMLLHSGPSGNVQSEMLLRKDPGIFTFREGWAFPRKIVFNGVECVMPQPDDYPRLPNNSPLNPEHIDDDDNSQDGDEPWQFQKGKDVDLTPLPPRARKIPARYK
ncbi:hypothetical protein IFM89_009846, partial [Coptis chinensis]